MVDSIAVVRFAWDSMQSWCRATAYDSAGNILGEVTVDLPGATRNSLWKSLGVHARYRIEDLAEQHLRAMLELKD